MDDEAFQATYGVQLLCRSAPAVDKAALLERLAVRCPGVRAIDGGRSSTAFTFVHPALPAELHDATIPAQTWVAVSDKPLDVGAMAAALEQTRGFADAGDVVASRRASVLVTDFMSSGLPPGPRLDLFQRALRAVLDVVPCAAIHWEASKRIVDPRAWCSIFDDGDPAPAFFSGAVNVRLFQEEPEDGAEQGAIVMDTLGLAALGLPDLQCHFRDLDPDEVAEMLLDLSWYLFENGDVIQDNHTVPGLAPGSRWRCWHEDALAGPERVVLDVDPGAPHAAGDRSR
jgi:hypothetical protein